MKKLSEQVGQLLHEMHVVNQELAETAEPLQWLSNLDLDQRQRIGSEIRTGLARWDSVSQRIMKALGDGSGNDSSEKDA